MSVPTERKFRKDVASHQMEVILDEGLHRHLRFKRPETSTMSFRIITWPGSLCYTGDMGSYVFSRIEDMFEFFRSDYQDKKLHINTGYWSEKLDAIDRNGAEVFSPELFKKRVMKYARDARVNAETKKALQDQVLSCADDGEYAAYSAAHSFKHDGFQLQDFWETDCTEYTYRFVWCCYALVWSIQRYDKAKPKKHNQPIDSNSGSC